jgi:hypothetical protein
MNYFRVEKNSAFVEYDMIVLRRVQKRLQIIHVVDYLATDP